MVGNVSSILFILSVHAYLPNLYRSLHLYNILVTPTLLKTYLFVNLQKNNKCAIEFSFSLNDF